MGFDASKIKASALRWFMIGLLSIYGAHITDGAIIARHIDDGAVETAALANDVVTTGKILNGNVTGEKLADSLLDSRHFTTDVIDDVTYIADDLITEGKLTGALRSKINGALATITANRAPGADDDSANTSGLVAGDFTEGTAVSIRAMWIDVSDPTNPQMYRCYDATAGAAKWIDVSNVEADDLGDMAFKDFTTVQSDLVLTASQISDFQAASRTAGDSYFAGLASTNTFTGANGFEFDGEFIASFNSEGVTMPNAKIQVLNLTSSAKFFNRTVNYLRTSVDNVQSSADALDTDLVSSKYMAKAIDAATSTVKLSKEKVIAGVGETTIAYTANGDILDVVLTRGGVEITDATTFDAANKRYTFDIPVQDSDDKVILKVFYTGNA